MSASQEAGMPPPGWYADPSGPAQRWWDGERWTDEVSSEEYVLHPPSTYVPRHPVLPRAEAPPPPARPRPSPPPRLFWVLPVVVVTMIAGAAGTWVSVAVGGRSFATLGGLQNSGDGWLVVLAAMVAAILLAIWVFERATILPVVAAIVGAAAALVALYRGLDPATGVPVPELVEVSPGWGVWVALVASLALAAVSALLALSGPKQPRN